MNNKERAIEFLKSVGLGNVRAGYADYVSSNFTHHNQYFKGDRESLLLAMEEAHQSEPNKNIEIKQVFESGDHVITHSLVQKEKMDIVVVHIFRFEGDKIAELWDVGQVIEANGPNENGLF